MTRKSQRLYLEEFENASGIRPENLSLENYGSANLLIEMCMCCKIR